VITLLVITDGRRACLQRTLESFQLATRAEHITRRIIVNDCPDPAFRAWVDTLGFDLHVPPERKRRGFAGAIITGWEAVGAAPYVFHLEDDFCFTRHVDVRAMIKVLAEQPHLAQMALRRQPWNETEIAAGGVVEAQPDAYEDRSDGYHHWLEHRMFFTTNPSVYPQWVRELGWPLTKHSEGIFSQQVFGDPAIRSAYWGLRTDGPWVLHIGEIRTGTGF
jgi:hypothetical protein